MKINDKIYGLEAINEPVLMDLINSKPIQRLKKIQQAGITGHILKDRNYTRYEHSVGVMILLRKKGASLEEQIQGLLHDVAHTAFSHVVDFIFKSKDHTYHEKEYKNVVLNSEIPQIIKDYNLDINIFLEGNGFSLLEREIPDLCADRIDYSLRDIMNSKLRDYKKIKNYIENFIIHDNEIIVSNRNTAKEFATDFLDIDEKWWANILEVAYFQIAADAIKIALNDKIINEKDLFKNDDFILDKLKSSKNKSINEKLKFLTKNLKVINSPRDYDFYSRTKLRYVDPKFMENGEIKRLSDVDKDFKERLKQHKALTENGCYVKIVSC